MRWGEALVEALVTTSDDAVVGADAAGRVISWNRGAERVFGRAAADAVGEPLTGLFPTHLRAELQTVLATVAAGEPVHHVETEIVRADGLPVPLLLSVAPVLDGCPKVPGGDVVGALAVARDLTEQRLAQARLAEVEEQVRESEALAHVGSWLWDVHTGTVQWSEELHRIHGVEPLDFEGTLDAHLRPVHPEDRRRVRAALDAAVAPGTAGPLELRYRVRRPGGEERVLHVRAQPALDSTGAVLGLRGIGQDVTDHR